MADQSQVEDALLALATAALYPQGTTAPSAIGVPCRTHRGAPLPAALQADLARGIVIIAITPVDHSLRVCTRFADGWYVSLTNRPTLSATIADDQVRFAGEAAPGQIAGILADGHAVAWRTRANDTPASVAAQLAAQLRASRIVQLSGAAVIIPGARDLRARVVADQPALRELRRQSMAFRIACLCPTPALRDAAGACIDLALAQTAFPALPDGARAHMVALNSASSDNSHHSLAFRRDLIVRAEYPTTEAASLPAMLFGAGSVNAAPFVG